MNTQKEMRQHFVESGIPAKQLPHSVGALARILPGCLSLCCRAPVRYKNVDPRATTVECGSCAKVLIP